MLQPLLPDQAKLSLQGSKNKIVFYEGSANMEEQKTDNSSTLHKEVDGNESLNNVITVQSDNVVPALTDMYKELHLAAHEICTLEGNKNGIGSLDGS